MSQKHKHDNAPAAAEAEVVHPDDIQDIMRKYDRESNTRIWEGVPAIVVRCVMAAFSVYCIWSTLFSTAGIEVRLSAFVGFIIVMGYLTYPASKKHVKPNTLPWYDIVILVLGAGAFFYFSLNYMSFARTITSAAKLAEHPMYVVIAIIGILSLVELCRRCVGIPILCVAGVLVVYTFASGLSLSRVAYTMFYTTSGILSTPISVCAKYIVVFIIFGAFLERTGISAFFIDLANSIAGSSSGGPAKVAVISSALCGMVSGSSVGNTVTTGSITIPMMKKTGYPADFAGAVEAAASTGGQIMPPIMGAAAFIMVEIVGERYSTIAACAILPALLYFAGIFISVHLEAKKLGLKGIPKEELPRFRDLVSQLYLLLPLIVLVVMVATNIRTIQTSATIAIFVAIAVSLFNKGNRITPKKILEALEAGGKGTITVAVACAMAGIIAGCITVTGLGSKLLGAIMTASMGLLPVALFLTMICCIILGMGVPTTANYCIMATTCAPILTEFGVPLLAANFFVFYFGIVADITPPVALAAYAGSAIAKGNPMKTGVNATRLAIAAFIVPYVFALNPSMLLVDAAWYEVIQITITSLVGIFGVAAALGGFFKGKIHWALRILMAGGGLLLIIPGTVTDIIGVAIVAAVCLLQHLRFREPKAAV